LLTVRFGSSHLEVQGGMADYQELRQRHVAYLASIFPQWVQRLRWPAERLRQERQERLRELLRVALASSPWHRERLAGVDPEAFTEEDLPGLPAMTKDDLMANWDGIVSDRRLTLDLAERHLAGLASDAYLFDELHVIASGGSTGRRGCTPTASGRGPSSTPASCGRCCGTAPPAQRSRRCPAPSRWSPPSTPPT
jgi:hypothetical protein